MNANDPHQSEGPRPGRWAVALAAYSGFLAIALLSPGAQAQSASVGSFAQLLRWLGLPASLASPSHAEFLANALILMPVSALGSLTWPRSTWRDWTAWAFLIAVCVEGTQGLLLPSRSATSVDVVANTLGGLGGAAALAAWRRLPCRC